MTRKDALATVLLGPDPKLRRMVAYWAATGVLYGVCTALILVATDFGLVDRAGAYALTSYSFTGVLVFMALVRFSAVLGIAPRTLAVLQGLFAISCNMWVYTIAGPLREASLIMLLVVVAFCTFAMRPRQTLLLSAAGIAAMGATMWWHAAHDPAHYPPLVEGLTFGFASAGLFAITLLTGEMNKLRARLKRQKEDLLAAVATIRTLATVDELTSLANRRHMNEVLAAEERRQAHGHAACIALLDIDFFKTINDRFGHAHGDAVLRAFAQAAQGALRGSDMLARWGGEEFLLMLPNADLPEAQQVLARIAAKVVALEVPGLELDCALSFSAGVTARAGGEPFADTINRADKALYRAKAEGRNRVVAA
ncbi:GGDEF domain-containing protein [Massilia agilis]|uniref:diguanylate cyclase n=1 Tax=Massilia agilis TaxID=1811226 RepID=A0ABT2DCV5_9BURK|nr:GGDEF domain-containing protein [Massilia agilis]MCS0808248.1 GGDEF domain-containing protein [Massilia agilis]